jgi:hypothetical protein
VTLIANLPPIKCWCRKEYLRDLRDGHGEYELAYWVSIKSVPGRAFYVEAFLPHVGCMFDKLPISAFLAWDPDHPDEPVPPDPDLPLRELQFWNCFSYDITVLEKNLVYDASWKLRSREHGDFDGDYLFTVDSYFGDRNRIDLTFSETPDEHKSFNFVQLNNGQFAAYPNNRCRIVDESLSPEDLTHPYMLVSTRYFSVENVSPKWGRLGAADEYCWSTETEREGVHEVPRGEALD